MTYQQPAVLPTVAPNVGTPFQQLRMQMTGMAQDVIALLETSDPAAANSMKQSLQRFGTSTSGAAFSDLSQKLYNALFVNTAAGMQDPAEQARLQYQYQDTMATMLGVSGRNRGASDPSVLAGAYGNSVALREAYDALYFQSTQLGGGTNPGVSNYGNLVFPGFGQNRQPQYGAMGGQLAATLAINFGISSGELNQINSQNPDVDAATWRGNQVMARLMVMIGGKSGFDNLKVTQEDGTEVVISFADLSKKKEFTAAEFNAIRAKFSEFTGLQDTYLAGYTFQTAADGTVTSTLTGGNTALIETLQKAALAMRGRVDPATFQAVNAGVMYLSQVTSLIDRQARGTLPGSNGLPGSTPGGSDNFFLT